MVVVANTEESNFWAEVEQGFHRTIFGMKLVGPKDGGESHVKFWNFQQWVNQDTPKGKHVNIHAPLIT